MVGFGFYGCLQTIPHATGCQMRRKNNVRSNSMTHPNDRTRYAHRDDAFSSAHCLECVSPKWMNLRTWIATSTVPVKGNFDEFHKQWLMHWHSNQIADLFNSRNITSLNQLFEVALVKTTYLAPKIPRLWFSSVLTKNCSFRFRYGFRHSTSLRFLWFKRNSLSASWLVLKLTSPHLDWQQVGLSVNCPVKLLS